MDRLKPSFMLIETLGLRPWKLAPTTEPAGVIRCLLIEGRRSLMLVEVGLGTLDRLAPVHRLGFLHSRRFQPASLNTVRQQLVMTGYRPDDVTDIFVSHLHVHHTGGLHDFPKATVHGLRFALGRHEAPISRQLPDPSRWTEPQGAAQPIFGFPSYPILFEDIELRIVTLNGRYPGHAGLLIPYHDSYLFHVGCAVQSLEELTRPLTMPRDIWSTLASPAPFTELQTLTKLRRLYQYHDIRFISSFGAEAQLTSIGSTLPELRFLSSKTNG
jgi:glyoxylase-like metal-dependent hydrolase (beta-lactamase superfamily II)